MTAALEAARQAHRAGNAAMARAHLDLALLREPASVAALTLLGILQAEAGFPDEAAAAFQGALALDPDDAGAHANLGRLLVTEGAHDAGLRELAQAVRLAPENIPIRVNFAAALLKAGRYAEGWRAYEWRLRLAGHSELPLPLLLPTLRPDQNLSGRTILVTQEEGLGDFIQFARLIPQLTERGARVLLWTPDELDRLFEGLLPGVTLLVGDVDRVSFDWHCPILSLPRALGTTLDTIPAPLNLRPDPALVRKWRAALPQAAERLCRHRLAGWRQARGTRWPRPSTGSATCRGGR